MSQIDQQRNKTLQAIVDALTGITSAVTSVAGKVGNVTLVIDDITDAGPLQNINTQPYSTIGCVLSGGGSALSAGLVVYVPVDFDCTIVGGTLLADQTGSAQIDIYKCTYAQFNAGLTHPASGDSITGDNPLTISSASKAQDTTLTGWTTALTKGDVLAFHVDSATTIEQVTATLTVSRA